MTDLHDKEKGKKENIHRWIVSKCHKCKERVTVCDTIDCNQNYKSHVESHTPPTQEKTMEWEKGEWLKGMRLSGSQAEYILSYVKVLLASSQDSFRRKVEGKCQRCGVADKTSGRALYCYECKSIIIEERTRNCKKRNGKTKI